MSSGPESNSYEGSDESSENELLDRSLSVWRGRVAIEGEEDFAPCPLDIHTASSIGHYECVRSILARKEVDINGRNKGGWTPLMYACYIGHENILNLLLKAEANVNISNHKGQTSLMLASSCGNERLSYFLYQHGAELEARDYRGWTALFHATYAGHQNMVNFLLESNANMNAREPSVGMTPFMEAAAGGHKIIVQLMLQHGVSLNAKTCHGDTAQSLALMNGHMKIVSLIDQHMAARGLDKDLSCSEETANRLSRHPILGRGSRTKGSRAAPDIRDGPDAFARLIEQSRNCDMSNFPNTYVPEGYVTFTQGNEEREETYLRYRDVTSPINPQDHNLDSSGGKDSCDNEDDSTAFSRTGALTIKSSSGSSGGLAAALGLSHENSSDSDDVIVPSLARILPLGHENMSQRIYSYSRDVRIQSVSHTSVIPGSNDPIMNTSRENTLGLARLEISSPNNLQDRGYSSDPCRPTWGLSPGDIPLSSNHDGDSIFPGNRYNPQSVSTKKRFSPQFNENTGEYKHFASKQSGAGSGMSFCSSDLIIDPYTRPTNFQYSNFPTSHAGTVEQNQRVGNEAAGQFPASSRPPSQNGKQFPSDRLEQNHLRFLSADLACLAPPTNFPAAIENSAPRPLFPVDHRIQVSLDSFSQPWTTSGNNNNNSLFTIDDPSSTDNQYTSPPSCDPTLSSTILQVNNTNQTDSTCVPVTVTTDDSPSDKPQTLVELLLQLGLLKYLTIFEEQDVDLQVFLSLTDNDLKEIGIKLFGPRRKLASAIARWHSDVRSPSDGLERAYADRLEAEMQEMAIQLHQANSQVKSLEAEILQEQKLRSVTEGCFMEERALRQRERCRMEEMCLRCQQMQEVFERLGFYESDLRKRLLSSIPDDVKLDVNSGEQTSLDSASIWKELELLKKMDICSNELKQTLDFVFTTLEDLLVQENVSPQFVPTTFS